MTEPKLPAEPTPLSDDFHGAIALHVANGEMSLDDALMALVNFGKDFERELTSALARVAEREGEIATLTKSIDDNWVTHQSVVAATKKAAALWALLDDIDTASDMFKDNYRGLAGYTYAKQRRRFEFMSSEEWERLTPIDAALDAMDPKQVKS